MFWGKFIYNRKSSANIVENGNINMNEHGSGPHHDDDDHESENGKRDVDAMLAMAVVVATIDRHNRRRDPVLMHNSSLAGRIRIEEILNGHPKISQVMISMKADTFRVLSNLLSSQALLTPTYNMTVDEQLFIFLSICAQGTTNRQILYLFQHSKETTSH